MAADSNNNKQFIRLDSNQELSVLNYANRAHMFLLDQFQIRSMMEQIDREYMRENDYTLAQTRARQANRAGNAHKMQDVTVPIIMPQVRAALAYLGNVFLTGYPIFGVSSDPSQEDAALMMETIIAENAVTQGWARELIKFFLDGLKYNLHAIEVDWRKETNWSIETDVTYPNSAKPKQISWEGNCIRRMDLYNTFWDPRVNPSDLYKKGEYAGYIELMSRIQLKKFINELFGQVSPETAIRAFQSGPPGGGAIATGAPFSYYMPIINPYPLMVKNGINAFDWMAWSQGSEQQSGGIKYHNAYEVMTLYGRILPSDFNLNVPSKNTPQVWKFIIINGQVVLQAEKMSNVHNFIPIFFGQPLEDGLDYQTKSFATNVSDMQSVASAMFNAYMASKRRLVGDRVLYDPLRIRKEDINSSNPAAKIPVRPSAYGKPVGEAVYAFPFHDEQTRSLIDGASLVTSMADKINNQNPAQQGQFVKGNKTRHEYDDVMGHGNANNQMMALMTEAQVFTPVKEVIKLNILQFQGTDTLYNRDKNAQVEVKPEDLRKAAVHFKVSDGLTPTDKIMDGDEFQTALQVIGQSPAIAAGFNVAPLFTYIMKTRGADLRPFEKSPLQLQYEQQVAAWQQMAMEAVKAGQEFKSPMPEMPPELKQELQAKQKTGGANPSPSAQALETTTGG